MTLEQPSQGLEKLIEEKILGFKEDFNNWVNENPELAEKLKKELLSLSGLKENELIDSDMGFDFGFIKVPVKDLLGFGTACGTSDNKAFAPNVIALLEAHGLEFIIALGDNAKPVITSAAINIGIKEAKKFSKLIDKNNGSLREGQSKVPGWSVFESE